MCLSSVVMARKRAVFKQHHTDLVGLGKGSLTENIATSTYKFICKIYGVPEVDTAVRAWDTLIMLTLRSAEGRGNIVG